LVKSPSTCGTNFWFEVVEPPNPKPYWPTPSPQT
jgi:hypothetical protein